jgi:cell shape-determining protein MreD
MRWITFFILLYLMYALQIAHVGALGWGQNRDDGWPALEFLPLLAVFYALFAAETAGAMAALCCGLAYDIGNHDFAGTNMIPLALVALVIIRIRLFVVREHAIAHFVMALLGVMMWAVLAAVYRRLIGAPLYSLAFWPHVRHGVGNAVYTAVVAPGLFWGWFHFPKLLGFTAHGYRSRDY